MKAHYIIIRENHGQGRIPVMEYETYEDAHKEASSLAKKLLELLANAPVVSGIA
jgi:hypothetical protein